MSRGNDHESEFPEDLSDLEFTLGLGFGEKSGEKSDEEVFQISLVLLMSSITHVFHQSPC